MLPTAKVKSVSRRFMGEIWIALTGCGAGSGTAADPYDGSYIAPTYHFDAVMNDPAKVPAYTKVNIGPGTYLTKGSGTGGFKIRSGVKIVGIGIGGTIIQLVDSSSSSAAVAAIGADAATFLDSAEVHDLTIDANFTTSSINAANTGISVTGKHIRISRVRVIHFGTKSTTVKCSAISVGGANSALPEPPIDCVVEECIVELPVDNTGTFAQVTCIELPSSATSGQFHYDCVVRNCFIDGRYDQAGNLFDFAKRIRGISCAGGVGTIVEGNNIIYCYSGIGVPENVTKDVIVRNNTLYFVFWGVEISNIADTSYSVGRAVVLKNNIQLSGPQAGATGSLIAIMFRGLLGAYRITNAIARENLIRTVDQSSSTPGTSYGIYATECQYAIFENNIADATQSDAPAPNNTVFCVTNQMVKAFNNQSSDGIFKAAYDSTNAVHIEELTTQVELAWLSI